jgi:DNA primase
MTHFDKALLPPAKVFYLSEIGPLTREDRRGWAKGRCPFHESKSGKSFSVHVSDGGWFCHGCGVKGGDIVAFLMKRDGMNFRQACESLGAWKDLSADDRRRIETEKRDREQKQIAGEILAQEEKQARLEARDLLHVLEKLQRQTSEELCAAEKATPGVESKQKDCLFGDLCLLVDRVREAETNYRKLSA